MRELQHSLSGATGSSGLRKSTVVLGLAILVTGCASQSGSTPAQTRGYAFWPDAPDLPRIQYLTSVNSSDDLQQSESRLDRMLYGREKRQTRWVAKPYGVAMWNGRIYVCDIRGNTVMVFDFRNQQTRLMGTSGLGAIQRAVDVTVAPDGTKYVVDAGRGSIAVFDADERFVRSFRYHDSRPAAVAVNEDELYITDMGAQHVKVVNRYDGELLRTIGGPGGDDGNFIRPVGIATDPDGNIYVSDIIKARIQKFSPDGELLLAFGESGNRPGYFDKPKHLKVASDGLIYAVDAAFNNVQILDEYGKAMMFFGSGGAHTGAMDLPAGIFITDNDVELFQQYIHPAFSAQRLIIVTNQFGPNRVAIYAMGGLKEGKTLEDIAPGRVPTITVDESAAQPLPAEEVTTVQR